MYMNRWSIKYKSLMGRIAYICIYDNLILLPNKLYTIPVA